ncbi:hypothetical protein ACFSRY_00640 [Pontibacter locisalis]|uniref:Uncharacterized protein n=1 Tax=Pontibacter locisalis TaxID=1719035 RepID=A0ABW5IFF5_9BACT
MKTNIYKSFCALIVIFLFPLLFSCSTFGGGGSFSNDPEVAEQQRRVDLLEKEYTEAKRFAEEANQREKAAKDRLKAAEHELKALEEQAKRRSEY